MNQKHYSRRRPRRRRRSGTLLLIVLVVLFAGISVETAYIIRNLESKKTQDIELEQNEIALETMLTGPIRKRNMDLQMCAFRYTLGECYEANNDIKNALKQYQKVYSFDTTYENVKEKINNLTK